MMRFGKKNKGFAAVLTVLMIAALFLFGGAVPVSAKMDKAGQRTVPAEKAVENDAERQEPSVWGTRAEQIKWDGSMACQVFFNNGYYVQLAWNRSYSDYDTVRAIKLNGETWQAAFFNGTEALADDREFLKALRLSLLEHAQKKQQCMDADCPEWKYELNPIVLYAEGPFSQTASELAEQSYERDDLVFFGVVIEKADRETQESLADAAYDKEDYNYYSIVIDYLSADKRKELALRAYEEDKIALFTLVADSLSTDEKTALKERAAEDGRIDFYYIINETPH